MKDQNRHIKMDFFSVHLRMSIDEFIVYKGLDKELGEQIRHAIDDLAYEAFTMSEERIEGIKMENKIKLKR